MNELMVGGVVRNNGGAAENERGLGRGREPNTQASKQQAISESRLLSTAAAAMK